MPRQPRNETVPGTWHVWARGNDRRAIFRCLRDLDDYLGVLDRTVSAFRWRCLSYCLMPNHVHLLVETTVPNLGSGMGHAHGLYATRFNKRHERTGHVFEGRFRSKWIKDDAHLWTVARYIAMNPVEASLTRRPEEWRWSSHGAVIRGAAPPFVDADRLLDLFSGVGGDPRRRYADFVADSVRCVPT